MILTKKWIKELQDNVQLFCNHDDYNWDFSLMKTSIGKNWQVIYPQSRVHFSEIISFDILCRTLFKFARVYHLGGECGYHTKTHTCNHKAVLSSLKSNLELRNNLLFPASKLKKVTVGAKFPTKFKGRNTLPMRFVM